jgi:glucose-1-phosphate thymidylyltransferase
MITLDRGNAWLDTGTHESLMQAANFIQTIQTRQGLMIACPEEIAFMKRWISADDVIKQALPSSYGLYLLDMVRRTR